MSHRLTTFDDLRVGQTATLSRTIGEDDLQTFAALTGDTNPIHVDDVFARRTFFGSRIVHGMLTASLLSTIVGMFLPGTGAIYRSQTLEFVKPVRPGDALTVTAEVTSIDRDENVIAMRCTIVRADGEVVLRGKAEAGLILGFRD